MSATRAGGLKAATTNKERYGEDFFRRIGSKGGQASTTGGFAANRELAREAGRIGGSVSRKNRKEPYVRQPKVETEVNADSL